LCPKSLMTFCVNVESNVKQVHLTHHNKMALQNELIGPSWHCVRSMIHAQGLDLEFWAEAVNTAVYIKNRCPTKVLDSKTPQEAWIGTKPDVSHLRVFGCKTFAHIQDEKRNKLESKSIPCVFLGYCERTKTYRLMCLETKRIIKNRDIMFLKGMEEISLVEIGQNVTTLFTTTCDYQFFATTFGHFCNYFLFGHICNYIAISFQLFWCSSFHVKNV